MNMQAKLKFLVLSMALATAMMLPINSNAQGQNDDFFKKDDWATQRSFNITIGGGGLIPQGIGEPAPLGSGLLVLSLAGAGYAVTRRRRSSRKGTMLVLAILMLLGFTQCRKNLDVLPGSDTGKVHITLRVNDDSRVIVDTTNAATNGYAAVSFENGDKMYVGYNKNYVGYLTYSNGNFSGDIDITETAADEPLYFYFLGGKGFEPTFNGNVATLDISDQVLKYPVINYAHSVEVYPSATGDYTARLLNKCAIVKFHVTKPAGYDQAGTCITGMNNLVTVNFDYTATGTDEGFSYSQVNGGAITLPTKNGNVWAILLPQDELTEGGDMSVFSGRHKGVRPALPAIQSNDFIPTPYELILDTEFQPTGALSGLFKVNAAGKMVRFSKGNLKATTTDGWATWTWSFRDTQYEYEVSGDVGNNYANRTEVGLFGWATSGYNIRESESSNYFYKPNATAEGNTSSYGPGSYFDITGAYAKGDWGYNRITNNAYYQWRVLTKDEWDYLIDNHTTRWVKITGVGSLGTKDRCYGIAMLPYNSTETLNSQYTVAQWAAMEENGAIFFPHCGFRAQGTSSYSKVSQVDTYGYFWSSTNGTLNNGKAYGVDAVWAKNNLDKSDVDTHRMGKSVRLVCE